MQQVIAPLMSQPAMSFISQIENIFKSLPHLPKGISEFLVKVTPWLALLGGILTVLGSISNLLRPNPVALSILEIDRSYFMIMGLIGILSGALLLLSFQHLKEKAFAGWILLFWVNIISLIQSLVSMIYGMSTVIGVLIGAAIGFYIIFELKPYYKSRKN